MKLTKAQSKAMAFWSKYPNRWHSYNPRLRPMFRRLAAKGLLELSAVSDQARLNR